MLRRAYTTSTTQPVAQIHRGRFRVPTISTLRPEKLVHSDFLVLAGILRPSFHTQLSLRSPEYGTSIRLAYRLYKLGKNLDAEANGDGTTASAKVRNRSEFAPFPAHSQGFLYLHQPQPQSGLPRSASSIRFRCVPSLVEASSSYVTSVKPKKMSTPLSEPVTFLPPELTNPEIYKAFKAGYDLTLPNGIPWSITVAFVAARSFLQYVRFQLLEEKIFSEGELREYKSVYKSTKPTQGRNLFYTLGSVLPVRLDSSRFTVWTMTAKLIKGGTEKGLRYSFFWGAFMDLRAKHRMKLPYTGAAHVRFELAPGSDPKKPTLHLRIVKITEPVKCVISGYDGYVHMPKEGELVARGLPGNSKPWTCQLDPFVRSHSAMFLALAEGYAANSN